MVLAACNASLGPAPAVSQQDLDFVTYATALIRFDEEEGKLARKEAQDPAMLEAVNKITSDANQFAARIHAAAARAGIKPPGVLPSDLRVRLAHMRLQQSVDFDRNYLDDQIYSHENALAGLEDEAAHGAVPELRALAQQAVPLVKANLVQLRSLQREMPM